MREFKLTQDEFDFIYTKVPRFCVDLRIKTKSGTLVTRRTIEPQLWHLPGGTLIFNETIDEAIRRVAMRELGVEVKDYKFMELIEVPEYKNKEHTVAAVYEVKIEGDKIYLNEEASEYGWCHIAPVDTLEIHKRFIE